MWQHPGTLLALAAAIFGSGCAAGHNAQGNVLWHLEHQDSVWLEVNESDFEGIELAEAEPSSHGSNLLIAAVRFSGGAKRAVQDQGIPDGVRVIFTGDLTSPTQATRIELAYLRQSTVIVVEPRGHKQWSTQPFEVDPLAAQVRLHRSHKPIYEPGDDLIWQQYHSRPLTDEDLAAVEPELALRRDIERWARVLTIGRTLALSVEPSDFAAGSAYKGRPGFAYNYLTVPVTAASATVFGETPELPGRFIAWVAPNTAAAEVLEVGWRILTINGQPVASFEVDQPGQDLELVLQHSNETRTVILPAERRPIDVSFGVWSVSHPGFANVSDSTAHIGVGGPLLDLLRHDDALAALLGHEIAHVIQTVDAPPKASEEAAKAGIWLALGILSPAIAQGLVDRFQQDDERAADMLGLRLAHRAGYDPFGGVQMLDAIQEHKGEAAIGALRNTHPPYRERRDMLYGEALRLRALGSNR